MRLTREVRREAFISWGGIVLQPLDSPGVWRLKQEEGRACLLSLARMGGAPGLGDWCPVGPQELCLAAGSSKGTPRVAKSFTLKRRAACSWRGQPPGASVTLLLAAWQHCLHLRCPPAESGQGRVKEEMIDGPTSAFESPKKPAWASSRGAMLNS